MITQQIHWQKLYLLLNSQAKKHFKQNLSKGCPNIKIFLSACCPDSNLSTQTNVGSSRDISFIFGLIPSAVL